MTTINRNEHAFKRRIIVSALRPESIAAIQDRILKNIRYFCSILLDREDPTNWSPPRNMSKMIGYLVSDITGDITFSKNWNTQRDPQHRHFVEESALGTAGIHLVSREDHLLRRETNEQTGHMPSLFKLHLHRVLFRPLANGIKHLNALSNEITKWRIMQEDTMAGKDLFSSLLEAKDHESGQGLTQPELISEAGLLIVAGTDTTITGMTSALFYLLHHPSALARLQQEVRNAFPAIEDIRIGPQLEGCHFLTACIDESLRLTPPVGSILPREVLPGGITIDGEWFPPGTDLGVPHYALHHSKEHFSAPFEFQPDRWLAEKTSYQETEGPRSTRTSQKQGRPAFTPFGVGRTSCAGKYLAYQEMSLVLARAVWLYDMRIEPSKTMMPKSISSGKQFPTLDRFVSTHDGPMVQFRSRDLQ